MNLYRKHMLERDKLLMLNTDIFEHMINGIMLVPGEGKESSPEQSKDKSKPSQEKELQQ